MSSSDGVGFLDDSSVIGGSQIPVDTQMFVINQNGRENLLFLDSSQFLSMGNEFVLTPTQLSLNSNAKQDPSSSKIDNISESLEPVNKKKKRDGDHDQLKKILVSMQLSFVNRLKGIEDKIEKICSKYHLLEEKVDKIFTKVKDLDAAGLNTSKTLHSPVIKRQEENKISCNSLSTSSDSKVESAKDIDCSPKRLVSYSEGSWLGDPNDRDLRVRCTLTMTEIDTINRTCLTPEKMGLTLMDFLFDRETQACSNISGIGKHGKAQLDPIKIHGIKCHLTYRFGITDKGWQHIKQSIDSKCRSYFRRKQSGLSLHPRSGKKTTGSCELELLNPDSNMSFSGAFLEGNSYQSMPVPSSESDVGHDDQESGLSQLMPLKMDNHGFSFSISDTFENSIIHTDHGDIQIIKTTKEQLQQLKQNNQIQILTGPDV